MIRDYSNNPFSFAPRNTVGGAFDVEIPIGDGKGTSELHADMYYQDVTYLQDTIFDPLQPTELLRNTALRKVPAYTVFNARVDWKNAFEKRVDLSFFVRNLIDNNYFVGGVDLTTSASVSVGMMGAPRTYGVEVGYTF